MKTLTFLAIPALLLLLASCLKEPDFSDVPSISFGGFDHRILTTPDRLGNRVPRDSVVVLVDFQDGDGDLGITTEEFQGKGDPKLKGVNNYIVRVMRKTRTGFVEVFPQVPFNSFYPPLKPDGRRGPIEGTLRFSQIFFGSTAPKPLKDTLKFQIRILDRALHESNVIETDTIIVFPPVYKP
ncbi:MAG: hypothetical protein H7Y12_15800 [Sphingobacteriaceae bacterium]|nr:hypothetical protein [Cytophagaceae bacterium]